MAEWLKLSASAETKSDTDRKVSDYVETILADIADRGNAAVRELSIKLGRLVQMQDLMRATRSPKTGACRSPISKLMAISMWPFVSLTLMISWQRWKPRARTWPLSCAKNLAVVALSATQPETSSNL